LRHVFTLLALPLAVACHGHDHGHGDDHGHAHDEHGHGHSGHAHGDHGHGDTERPALSFTHWTDASELFIELPALVVGQESPCAAHVTRLEGFVALAEGRVSVVLRGGGPDERVDADKPTAPGIYRPVVRPTAAGPRRLIVEVRAPGLSADHDLGEVQVFERAAAAREALPEGAEPPGRVSFLKEQQWPMDFGTAVVARHAVQPTLRLNGQLISPSDGEVVLTAPASGRLNAAGAALPRPGARVATDDLLAVLSPRLEAADLASLELAVTSADLELRYADRERKRLETLSAEGAVPERRVLEATHAVDAARAARNAAERRIDQFRRVQRTSGGGDSAIELRATIAGIVTEVRATAGSFVEAGAPLLRVTDPTRLWLEARVPEADLGRLQNELTASFYVDGHREPVDLAPDALVARGLHVDAVTRTLPITFTVDNASGRFVPGAFARVELASGPAHEALAVPASALVDDGGAAVVFVQVEGESFERRVVRTGLRHRGLIEITSGLTAGERVVVKGAWSVKLAASSGAVPAHGHAH
jgi:cobalt-zinc-cadmium efflux system membrane fusion protein